MGSILDKFGGLWDKRPNQDWGNGGYANYQGGTRTFESDMTDVLSRGFSPHGVYRDFASVRNEVIANASAASLMDMARNQLELEQVEGMLGDPGYLQRLKRGNGVRKHFPQHHPPIGARMI